jgi:hypothetical protein
MSLLVGCARTLVYESNVTLGGMRFRPSGRDRPRASIEMLKIQKIGNSTVKVIPRRISWSASCLGHGSFFSSSRRPAHARWPKRK